MAASCALFVLNRVQPAQDDDRVKAHCVFGLGVLVVMMYHLVLGLDSGIGWADVSQVGLVFIIIATGTVLRYLPDAGAVRYTSSSVHPAMVIALLVSLLFHVLDKVDFI
ncbi:MAG: hypothetical protein NWE89_01555 [Candidatus Bathyarchaeota archaeon]|nr:hypothetical protein [Candidatus Bathyarchaeota archaeon]